MAKRKIIEDSDDEDELENAPLATSNSEPVCVNLDYSPPSEALPDSPMHSLTSIGAALSCF